MPITGTPTDSTSNTVVVTPTGNFTVNGEGGTDALEFNYSTLTASATATGFVQTRRCGRA